MKGREILVFFIIIVTKIIIYLFWVSCQSAKYQLVTDIIKWSLKFRQKNPLSRVISFGKAGPSSKFGIQEEPPIILSNHVKRIADTTAVD